MNFETAIKIESVCSIEISELIKLEHKLLLRKLEGTKYGKTKGIIPTLNENNFVLVKNNGLDIKPDDYFIETTYIYSNEVTCNLVDYFKESTFTLGKDVSFYRISILE